MDELGTLDALGLAALVAKNEVTPLELVDGAIARIEAGNGRLNAVVYRMYDEARRAASAPLPDGPLRGVPFLIKDIIASVAGTPMTAGSRLGAGHISARDSELVRRYRRAGLVLVGKTNTPEMGILPTTEPVAYGPTRNPWDPTRSPGGSSGGAAAAVAAGWVPAAHASDGGGSIRIPASCCGLFGLKPTRARTPLGPDYGDIFHGLVVEHALTRSVRDSAALLDATAGPDVGDPYWAPPQVRPFLDEVGADPGRLRIGYMTQSPSGSPVAPECVAAVERAIQLLRELGHEVESSMPVIDGAALTQAFITLWVGGNGASIEALAAATGRTPSSDLLEPLTWAMYQLARGTTAVAHTLALAQLQRIAREVAHFFQRYDVFVTPTLAEPPAPLGSFDAAPGNPMAGLLRAAVYTPFTPIANFTGQPAMSVPLDFAEGLPIGVQFVGRFGDEATLFRLAAQLEAARPWAGRRP